MSRLLVSAVALLMGACGFQLQSPIEMPPEMQRTYIDALERNTQFHRELRRQLLATNVSVVESPDEATAILTVAADETGQRVLSVSARNVPTEYEVFYSIGYSLVAGDKRMLMPQDLTFTRDYTWDETLVLGKQQEEDLMREAIVSDLVRTVLKQISAL